MRYCHELQEEFEIIICFWFDRINILSIYFELNLHKKMSAFHVKYNDFQM